MQPYFKPAALVAACMLLLAVTAGCGESSDSAQEIRTVTVTQSAERDAAPAPEPAPEQEPAPVEEPAPEEDAVPEEASSAGRIRVPDVTGEDHQLAQDTMQAAGLYNLAEEDATGQDRVLLMDRNWTTVSQSPAAGTMVNADRTIVLRARKDGE